MRFSINNTTSNLIFGCFLTLHILLWSILPELARYTASNDLIEAANWAQHLTFGYDKNPWVVGWITRLGLEFTGGENFLGYYFIQQVCIGLGFWSLWQLGRKLFNPTIALITVLLWEGCLYFSTTVQTNNDNFILIGFLTFTIYVFFLACETQKLKYWLLTGLGMGLAVMTKYSAVILLPWMYVYFYFFSWRAQVNALSVYRIFSGIVVFLILCIPNFIWLMQHDFISIRYLFVRQSISELNFWVQHFYYPLNFIYKITLGILPSFLLLIVFLPFKKHKEITRKRLFLILLGLGPLFAIIMLAMVFGWQLYWEWGVPFVPLLSLVFLAYFQPTITKKKFISFITCTIFLMLTFAGGYYFLETNLQAGKGSADYPAKEIATTITKIWWQKFHCPLRYVAGNRYIAGFVAFYSKDKPRVFVDWNPLYSSDINSKDVRKYGAVFVNDGTFGTLVLPLNKQNNDPKHFPDAVLKAYPTLQILPVKVFPYYRNEKTQEKVEVLIAVLPPHGSS